MGIPEHPDENIRELKVCTPPFTGDTKLPAQRCHFLTIEKPGNELETFIHSITLFSGRLESSPKYLNCVTYVPGIKCNLCVGKLTRTYKLSSKYLVTFNICDDNDSTSGRQTASSRLIGISPAP